MKMDDDRHGSLFNYPVKMKGSEITGIRDILSYTTILTYSILVMAVIFIL